MRAHFLAMTVTTIFVLTLVTIALAADPFVGTWKVNVAKSKTTDPSVLPKSHIVKSVGIDNGLESVIDGIDAEGNAYHIENSVKYDGKDYPVTGFPLADTVVAKKTLDANSYELVFKKAGKVVEKWLCVVTKDGKMMTLTGKGTNAKGQEYKATFIYDRQ